MHYRITPRPEALRKAINKHANGSRDQLARLINVDKTTTYRVEAEKVDPSPRFIAGLIQLTGLKFEQLFEISEASSPTPGLEDRGLGGVPPVAAEPVGGGARR